MTVQIQRVEAKMFEFALGDEKEVHRIPLAAYLPCDFVDRARNGETDDRFAFAMLHEFCPELDGDQNLNLATVKAIFDGWNEASRKDGADLGK
jgi:hypothetical protein